jgi:hypothetical protein
VSRRRKKAASRSETGVSANPERPPEPSDLPVSHAVTARSAAAPVAARTASLRGPDARHAPEPTLATRIEAFAARLEIRVAAVVLSLGFFAICALASARTDTPTPDEFVYVPAGVYHLRTGDLSFDPTNPPLLKMLMAMPVVAMDAAIDLDPAARDNRTGWGPWIFGTSFMKLNRERYLDLFFAARSVIVGIGVLLAALVFVRARDLLSPAGAIAALVVFATLPPVLAHSAVATLDLGLTALVFAAFVATARFAATELRGWAAASGALFGLAFATKGTAALFAPLVPLLAAAGWKSWARGGLQRFATGGAVMAASAWIAILAAYRFEGFPLPAPLVEGVRFQLAASSAGEFPAFLAGSWSQTGWWYYYLVTLVLKTPIASLVLVAAGVAATVVEALRVPKSRATAAWLLLPPLLLIYVLSFHYAKDYGIRYLLPAFPFLALLAGRGVQRLLRFGAAGAVAAGALLGWQVLSTALAAPAQLAYFNELVGGPERARHLLLDSNLDWGQDLGRLAQWLHDRGQSRACIGYFGHVDPKVYGIDFDLPPATPAPGLCAISANFLGGYPYAITYAGDRIRGVRAGAWSWYDRLEPVARIGSSIYVFDVKPEDVAGLVATAP